MSTKLSLNEINKQLQKDELRKELRDSLKQKKDILSNNKIIKKNDNS